MAKIKMMYLNLIRHCPRNIFHYQLNASLVEMTPQANLIKKQLIRKTTLFTFYISLKLFPLNREKERKKNTRENSLKMRVRNLIFRLH